MGDTAIHNQNETVQTINAALVKTDKPMEQRRPEENCLWMVFSLANTFYALNAGYVLHISVLYEIIPFKNASAHSPGIVWGRGGMVRLLDLRWLFGQGDYRWAISREHDQLPMVIVMALDGQTRGIIVDNVVALEAFDGLIEDAPEGNGAQPRYILGTLYKEGIGGWLPVIGPDSFIHLKQEQPAAKIDWNSRIDMRLLAKKMRETGAL